jgi:hypothetical protein
MIANQLPVFLVVGPPRTGTSWLHKVLEPHATLPSPSKETRFFDVHFERGLQWYRRRFPSVRRGPMGEVAPTYFASAEARRNILATIPQVKIIFIFRHPVERALSLYRMKRAYGRLRVSLEEALQKDPEIISSGLYWSQLAEWRQLFPEQQLLVMTYDDLIAAPQAFVDQVTSFIGMPAIRLEAAQSQRVYSSERMTLPRSYMATRVATAVADWCKGRGMDKVVASVRQSSLLNMFIGGGDPLPDANQAAVHKLSEIFRPEVEQLEAMLGRGLESWKLH